MRAIRVLAVGVAATVVLLGPAAMNGQEDAADEGSHYLFGEVEGFLHPDEANPFGCEVGFTSDSTLFGDLTLLGATTVKQVNCFVPDDILDTIQLGELTYTAESGDMLTGTGSGNCIPHEVLEPGGVYTCTITTTITGGSGAFEGATGKIHAIGYSFNTQSDHPDAAPGDVGVRMLVEGLIEY